MCKCENCDNVELDDLIHIHDHDLEENDEHEQWLVSRQRIASERDSDQFFGHLLEFLFCIIFHAWQNGLP